MKWRDMLYGSMVYTERAVAASGSHGINDVGTKQSCKQAYTALVDIPEPL